MLNIEFEYCRSELVRLNSILILGIKKPPHKIETVLYFIFFQII